MLDTTGDFAELVLAMVGVAAKLERHGIAERTARGRAAKAKGGKFGRKSVLTPHQLREVRKRLDVGETTTQRRWQLQCRSGDDFEAGSVTRSTYTLGTFPGDTMRTKSLER